MDVEPITPEQFHAAQGVDDWRVLYWGAHAFFRATSYAQGAGLVAAIADLVAPTRHDPDVDLRREGVAVKLVTRGIRNLSERDIELARRISEAARDLGLEADASVLQVVQTAVASPPSAAVTPFWAAVLGYVRPNDTHLVDPLRRNSSFFLQPEDRVAAGRGRIHVDVCVPHDQVEARIAAALAAVRSVPHGDEAHVDVETYTWTVLPDPVDDLVAGIAGEVRWAADLLEPAEVIA
ncbi:4a-hydroxytetrahydrobiopterin dehydratase [Agromyces humi]|uniref:4a-hydroxytetrahydrobiopterin dehydratase n=1 Tax=Agromyces humi TaxID=1766800 RepID=UPI001359DE11|nr:4a-hydroxytetrahydrobiopterin dehydratase [Agromyces humi]